MQLRGPLWFFACSVLLSNAAAVQAPLPAGWPARIELGMADSPGGAAAMRATAPFLFRYQYLAGGVNTGERLVHLESRTATSRSSTSRSRPPTA